MRTFGSCLVCQQLDFIQVSHITRNSPTNVRRQCSALLLNHFPADRSLLQRLSVMAGSTLSADTLFLSTFCSAAIILLPVDAFLLNSLHLVVFRHAVMPLETCKYNAV
jgi:hypothetical protein